ncbi:polyketide beta-ketoacyl:ACP synthase [Chitinophaga pendula]|uniref:beta-ketoacyl synthase N-terminal-like domain-containing protein n=1 Tax=Chitinophaga TaxID=79328 RepID=UPI000BAF6BCE|nr:MULTISPECIES: beta-ketoacyl synthase N-terminal-like domain-containing protein [Chitinophaga]ASZ12885.1 polyketide beta-ketoacyl:ACP synthase [Chitinophaga sp. MD30]UCJ09486.1 polyketide beta-ketoacyl:ACP synthase [Chitinophaga pendula]
MQRNNNPSCVISGVGITAAVGQGKAAFSTALLNGDHAFKVMERPGRQYNSAYLGAEIPALTYPDSIPRKLLRGASLSAEVALVTLAEAWADAGLGEVDATRIGLIVGGSNVQQRELQQTYEQYRDRARFLRPAYGISFLDSDICGLCTEQFGIRGFAYTLGGASASGLAVILQAAEAVMSGQADVCIAIGALMDLSYWEFQAFRSLGAMGSTKHAETPAKACRPFDSNRDGFIYGESCGVVVVERADLAAARGRRSYATISGWAIAMDANRNPNPSYEGECTVIRNTLEKAGITAADIDYVNPHGTGSMVGDETELQALQDCGLTHAYINATKSITGHGISAAGTVEVIATLLQMEAGRLHPTRNLENPIVPSFNWVKETPVEHAIQHAISLSFGFGGINTAISLCTPTPNI